MKNHKSKDCRVTKGKKCMKCGIMGHSAKYCMTKNPKEFESHEVKANEITTESSVKMKHLYSKLETKKDQYNQSMWMVHQSICSLIVGQH